MGAHGAPPVAEQHETNKQQPISSPLWRDKLMNYCAVASPRNAPPHLHFQAFSDFRCPCYGTTPEGEQAEYAMEATMNNRLP